MPRLGWIEDLASDIRFAIRMLRRSPGMVLVAILALAFPIGATAAVISALYAVLIKPLPFERPAELAVIWQAKASEGWRRYEVAPGNYLEWVRRTQAFEQLAAINPYRAVTLTGNGQAEHIEGARVSANFFNLLGRQALMGRTFVEGEDRDGHDRVAVISEGLWRNGFGADPKTVGRTVSFDGEKHTIVGILPGDFPVRAATPDLGVSTRDPQVWRPLVFNEFQLNQRTQGILRVIGRLRTGVTLPMASEDMASISSDLADLYPESNEGWSTQVVPIAEQTVGEMSRTMVLAAGAVGLMLLLACVSVTGLLLARAMARRGEMATRVAIGASRPRIARQLLTESVLLALVGGLIGIAFAYVALPMLLALDLLDLPRQEEIAIQTPALLLCLGTVLLTGLMCGLAPVVRISRELNAGRSRRVTETRRHRAFGNALVMIQVAISCVLLVGTGLLVRTVARLQAVDPGFDPRDLLVFHITLPSESYGDPQDRVAFFRRSTDQFRYISGVRAVGSSTSLPFMKRTDQAVIPYFLDSQQPAGGQMASANSVLPGYFDAMRIPLQRGRLLSEGDDKRAPLVMVVNQEMAAQAWPGRDPIGQKISVETDANHHKIWRRVVGVVGNVHPFGLDSPEQPAFYLPQAQFEVNWQVFALRAERDAAALAVSVRNAIRTIDPSLPVHSMTTMAAMIEQSLRTRKAVLGLLSVLGCLAVVVAGVGLYGLLAYRVQQSRKEIGIRSALGATWTTILQLVFTRGLKLAAIGIVLGLLAASICGRALEALLFEVRAVDLPVYAACSAALLVVAVAATAVPSWRALRVNPSEELRRE